MAGDGVSGAGMSHVVGQSLYRGLLLSKPQDAVVGGDGPIQVVDAIVTSAFDALPSPIRFSHGVPRGERAGGAS
jgi:hypothetical protein